MFKKKVKHLKQTLGLPNHVIDLNVASLFKRSPRSQGLHNGASEDPTEAEECFCNASITSLFDLSSPTTKADEEYGRFFPLDNCTPDGLALKQKIFMLNNLRTSLTRR